MSKFRTIRISFNTRHYNLSVPNECPYCAIPTNLNAESSTSLSVNSTESIVITTVRAHCCNKLFILTHLAQKRTIVETDFTLLSSYPRLKEKSFDPYIEKLSPRYISLYTQALHSIEKNDFDLAAAGIRNAMEMLLRDYALKELEEPENEVKKARTLGHFIQKYLPGTGLEIAATFVKEGGNDNTHYFPKYESFDVENLAYYLELIEEEIIKQYRIKNPPYPEKLAP